MTKWIFFVQETDMMIYKHDIILGHRTGLKEQGTGKREHRTGHKQDTGNIGHRVIGQKDIGHRNWELEQHDNTT